MENMTLTIFLGLIIIVLYIIMYFRCKKTNQSFVKMALVSLLIGVIVCSSNLIYQKYGMNVSDYLLLIFWSWITFKERKNVTNLVFNIPILILGVIDIILEYKTEVKIVPDIIILAMFFVKIFLDAKRNKSQEVKQ